MTDVVTLGADSMGIDSAGPGIVERHGVRTLVIGALVLFVFSVALVATYIPDQDQLSVFDEWVYLDYVDQVTDLRIAQRGEPVIGEALEVLSCRGVQLYGTVGSPCGGPYDTTLYPQGGITAADVHPPTYFALAAGGAAVVRGVGASDDLLTSARSTGAIFLFVGLLGIAWLALELGARPGAAIGVAGVVASLPLTRYTNSYLTPDNLNLAVGAAALIAAVRFARGRWPWWPLVAVAVFAGTIKAQNALAIGCAALFLLWSAVASRHPDRPGRRRHILVASAAVGAFVSVQLLWQLVRSETAIGEVPDQGVLGPLTWNLLVHETAAFILDLGLAVTDDADPTIAYFSAALLVAGCIGAVLYRPVADRRWGLAGATAVMLVIGSPLLVLLLQVVLGDVIPSPSRYGGSLLPGMAAATAAAFSSRMRAGVLAGFGAAAVAIMVLDNVAR